MTQTFTLDFTPDQLAVLTSAVDILHADQPGPDLDALRQTLDPRVTWTNDALSLALEVLELVGAWTTNDEMQDLYDYIYACAYGVTPNPFDDGDPD